MKVNTLRSRAALTNKPDFKPGMQKPHFVFHDGLWHGFRNNGSAWVASRRPGLEWRWVTTFEEYRGQPLSEKLKNLYWKINNPKGFSFCATSKIREILK